MVQGVYRVQGAVTTSGSTGVTVQMVASLLGCCHLNVLKKYGKSLGCTGKAGFRGRSEAPLPMSNSTDESHEKRLWGA